MFDPALTSIVLRQLVAAVSSWLRRRARRLGVRGALKTGAIAVIQRFNSAAAASPHFHTLFLDGVFAFRAGAAPIFHPTPAPRDEDVARVAASVFRRVERPQRGEDHVLVDVHAVDIVAAHHIQHQHEEVDVAEVASEPRAHLLLRRCHEAAADGAAARAPRAHADGHVLERPRVPLETGSWRAQAVARTLYLGH